jgi:hypothetical protein
MRCSQLFEGFDKQAGTSKVFATFTTAICALLRSPAFGFPNKADAIEAHFLAQHRAAASARGGAFNIALYSEVDGSGLTIEHAAALAIECQVGIAKAIGTIGEPLRPTVEGEIVAVDAAAAVPAASPNADTFGAANGGLSGSAREMEVSVVREMVAACWKALLGALSLLMASFGREEAVQHVLKCYQARTCAPRPHDGQSRLAAGSPPHRCLLAARSLLARCSLAARSQLARSRTSADSVASRCPPRRPSRRRAARSS